MAAIDLTRLDRQIDHLAALYHDPAAFQAELHTVFSFYHRYSHRKQKETISKTFMRNYDMPDKVLPHIEARLKPLSLQHPDEALTLADQLWQDQHYESRELATTLVGNLPISHQEQALAMIESWLQQPLDRAVANAIIANASRRIQIEAPVSWKSLILKLLDSGRVQEQKMGLLALAEMIPNSHTDELPGFLAIVREYLVSPESAFDKYLQLVIEALSKKTQQETAYLLREVISDSYDARVGRRIRHYLDFFDEPTKTRILGAIKNQVILPVTQTNGNNSA